MDITIKMDNHTLNVRSAAIIIHKNKVLLHKNKYEDYYALLGGRTQIGESSIETVKREVMEEIGKEIEVTGYCCTIENFFNFRDSEYHEIMFVHLAEFVNDEDKKIEETLQNVEGKERLEYKWLDLDKINDYKIKPEQIKKVLSEGKFPVHVVNDDR